MRFCLPSFSIQSVSRCLAVTCVLAAGAAHAQVPPMRGEGAVRYVCGGIGSDESTAMRAAMKTHPLSLLFARKDNAYLADVSVEIRGADGAPSVSLRADGPVCLIDLPAGRYDVQATSGGATQKQAVTVDRTPKTADVRF